MEWYFGYQIEAKKRKLFWRIWQFYSDVTEKEESYIYKENIERERNKFKFVFLDIYGIFYHLIV